MRTHLNRVLQGRHFRASLTAIAIVAMLMAAWRYRSRIADVLASADPWLLVLSIVLALLANFLTGLPFRLFLRQYRVQIPAARACYLQLVVQVTKYVPGNIWGAILQARILGSPRTGGIFLAGIDTTVFVMLTATATGLGLLACNRSPAAGILIAILGWTIAAAVASSAWLLRLAILLARAIGKSPPADPQETDRRQLGLILVIGALHALTYACSVMVLLLAATDFTTRDILVGAASLLLAWAIGTAVVIVPSGLGAREVAFVALAAAFGVSASPVSLAAIAIVARVMQTLPDVLAGVIVAMVESWTALRSSHPDQSVITPPRHDA